MNSPMRRRSSVGLDDKIPEYRQEMSRAGVVRDLLFGEKSDDKDTGVRGRVGGGYFGLHNHGLSAVAWSTRTLRY